MNASDGGVSEAFLNSLVDKVIFLEKKTGHKIHHRIMQPILSPNPDYVSIQETAKKIAQFQGLNDFTFIVAVNKQSKNVAGHIDLSTEGREVFIEIDEDTINFPEAVSAILCHEIAHKWLVLNQIFLPVELDNEILTDIACVFLGFGRIMLNGCAVKRIKEENNLEGHKTISESLTSGYLTKDQFALTYRLICEMRKIPARDYLEGLNRDSAFSIQNCDMNFASFLSKGFHEKEKNKEKITEIKNEIKNLQYKLCELNKCLVYFQTIICETIEGKYLDQFRWLEEKNKEILDFDPDQENDPSLRFLKAIKLKILEKKFPEVFNETDDFLGQINEIGSNFQKNSSLFPQPTQKMFLLAKCPKDGTILRLPESSGNIYVTCPTCKFEFFYNTGIDSLFKPKKSFFKWFLKFFK